MFDSWLGEMSRAYVCCHSRTCTCRNKLGATAHTNYEDFLVRNQNKAYDSVIMILRPIGRDIYHVHIRWEILWYFFNTVLLLCKLHNHHWWSLCSSVSRHDMHVLDHLNSSCGVSSCQQLLFYVLFSLLCQGLRLWRGLSKQDMNESLCSAASEGRLDEVCKLLELGANVRFQDNEGRTALELAVTSGHRETIKALERAIAELVRPCRMCWPVSVMADLETECAVDAEDVLVFDSLFKPTTRYW